MAANKPRIAFFDFTGCEGCQLTVIDSLQLHPELLEAVEIVQFREAMSERGEDYQIAFVEGACSRAEDEARLRAIRDRATMVIALGACAHLGGVNALRNWQASSEVRHYVYGEMGKRFEGAPARPVGEVIEIDGFLPGCPIDRGEFVRAVKALLQQRQPRLPAYPVCVECRLKENSCLLQKGRACLGSVTRAGCGALCPTFSAGCEGCRGLLRGSNTEGLKTAFAEHNVARNTFEEKMRLFQSYQLIESELENHGKG